MKPDISSFCSPLLAHLTRTMDLELVIWYPHAGDWVVPSEAAVCHSASVRRLLVSLPPHVSEEPIPHRASASTPAAVASSSGHPAAASGREGAGGQLLGGLWQLVHPEVTALHESAALRDCLGVRELSPLQLVGLAGVRGQGVVWGL